MPLDLSHVPSARTAGPPREVWLEHNIAATVVLMRLRSDIASFGPSGWHPDGDLA